MAANHSDGVSSCSVADEFWNTLNSDKNVDNGSATEGNIEDLCLYPCGDLVEMEEFSGVEDLINEISKDLPNDNLPEEGSGFPSENDNDGCWKLPKLAMKGNLPMAEAALQKEVYILNKKNFSGQTPLHLAVMNREKEIVKHIIKSNSYIFVQDEQGNTALHLAIRKKEDDIKLYGCFKVIIEDEKIEKVINTFNSQGN